MAEAGTERVQVLTSQVAASSVVITHPWVTANSIVMAVVSQAAADGTLLRVERVVPAAGSFTIYGTANATAATTIAWVIGPMADLPVI